MLSGDVNSMLRIGPENMIVHRQFYGFKWLIQGKSGVWGSY